MSISHNSTMRAPTDNGYSWYEKCHCCPYGFHIDLDFVRYCESVSQESDRTGSMKRRKDRRKQRQSMEVLLGITPPPNFDTPDHSYTTIQEQETPKIVPKQTTASHFPIIQDAFDDAVSDFERTLQRSKHKLSNNLPDVTAVSENIKRVPSTSSMSSTSGSSMTVLPGASDGALNNRDFDSVSIESCGLSPLALQNIREQMALSLERTKQLEEQVKMIPQLKNQLSSLKEENRRLLHQLQAEETSKLNALNANYLNPTPPSRIRSQSFTNIDSLDAKKEPPPPPPRKDFGVNCGVLTRNVGVGHQNPGTKTVSTATINGDFTDKWYSEKVKFLNNQNNARNLVAKKTQTTLAPDSRAIGSQTVKKISIENAAQTTESRKVFKNVGVTVSPKSSDVAVQKVVEAYNVGVSDDTISDVICEKCSAFKRTVGVGPESNEDAHTSPVSLAILMGPRSKSFNLGEERMNFSARSRTVACQSEPPAGVSKASQYEFLGVATRACQSEIKTQSKASQHEVKLTHKNTQSEKSESVNKDTDTKDLRTPTKHVACEAKEYRKTSEIGCNTTAPPAPITLLAPPEEKATYYCAKCESSGGKEDDGKKDGSPTPSRIPRPQIPTTPVENRKFKRQDTYTKIYSSPPNEKSSAPSSAYLSLGLSGLDLSSKPVSSVEPTSPLEKVKHNFKLSQNGAKTQPEASLPIPETTLFSAGPLSHRKKAEPSREMRGAMKVLNDSLRKSQTKNLKNHSAVSIIQQEWFKVSSLTIANPLDVEDYLDAFEEFSSNLLEYIVNMTDDTGNTAMHYAVSYGNFDVVSILLDSKVCDINKQNKAGYSSVMLVSLAQVRSQTHANVVKRLFQLADVNLRAKEHGQTALMLAVSQGRLDMVKMLLEAGADINIQDDDGSTALMCAAEHGQIDIVKHFLSHPDCDSTITDVDNTNALKIAMEAGHRHIGVLLYAHQRSHQVVHGKGRKSKSASPKTPSSPLPIRSSHRALTDTKNTK